MLQAIRQSPNYKWWAFGAIAFGTFISVVDTGSVMVALPDIERHFNTDLPTVQWVVVGYALAISVLLLPMGRLGDIAGRKKGVPRRVRHLRFGCGPWRAHPVGSTCQR